MPRIFLAIALISFLMSPLFCAPSVSAATPKSIEFPTDAHDDAIVEWWYVNAHVTTATHRHLAVVASFFRFGNGVSPLDNTTPMPRSHYLIYAVTDLDKKTQRSYSLADSNFVNALKLYAPFMAALHPDDRAAKALMDALAKDKLPQPHQKLKGEAVIVNSPFKIDYGGNTLAGVDNDGARRYRLILDAGSKDKIELLLNFTKPAMAVGGTGETGLKIPTDMRYFSLTRGDAKGSIDTGAGKEALTGGQGWFDHQWGNSWVAQNNGWDWWGVQLSDGTDILFWRQRDLATGKTFFPLATFMDKDGRQTITKNIVFEPDVTSLWKSPRSGIVYPLRWHVKFSRKNLDLWITSDIKDQEIPILGPGSSIWEGSCRVKSMQVSPGSPSDSLIMSAGPSKFTQATGTAYMELVGYNSPAVKAQFAKKSVKSRK